MTFNFIRQRARIAMAKLTVGLPILVDWSSALPKEDAWKEEIQWEGSQ